MISIKDRINQLKNMLDIKRSIRKRLFFANFSIVFFPISIITIFSIYYFSEKIGSDAREAIKYKGEIASILFNNKIEEIKNYGKNLSEDKNIQVKANVFLTEYISSIKEREEYYDIVVVDENLNIISENSQIEIKDEETNELLDKAIRGINSAFVESIIQDNNRKYFISSVTGIRREDKIVGAILIRYVLNNESLVKYEKSVLKSSVSLYGKEEIIATTDSFCNNLKRGEFEQLVKAYSRKKNGMEEELNKKNILFLDYLTSYSVIYDQKGEPIVLIEVKDTLERYKVTFVDVLLKYAFILFVCMIIAYMLVIFVAKTILVPLRLLLDGVERMAAGDLNFKIESKSEDEIGILSNGFNKMSQNLNEKIETIKLMNLELENEVERRTIDLTSTIERLKLSQEQLIRSEKMAENANKAKSQFLANMSHEIRTPLNGIIGMIDIIRKENKDERQQKYIDMIKHSSDSLVDIINDILDISKIEAGKIELEEVKFSLREIIDRIFQIFEPRAKAKKIEFSYSIDNKIPKNIIGDSIRIQQIIMNIVSNALKFTEKGEVEIKIVPKKITTESILISIFVIDTGIGIPEDKLEKLFKNFSQVDSSHTRKYGGTGLGLAISKQLVEMMDGKITISKNIVGGTIFDIELLLKKAEQIEYNETANIDNDLIEEDDGDNKLLDCKVLLAEDNVINKEILLELFLSIEIKIDTAENGKEAFEMYMKNRYDIIITDLSMPEVDGYELTQMIRENEKKVGSRVSIIALTANAFNEVKEKCLRIGMDDFISKPVNKKDLFRIIEKWYKKR